MKFKQTDRGFDLIEFIDFYGSKCSLQKSSIIESEEFIWFGVSKADHKAGPPWMDVTLPGNVSCFSRMHLSQTQVKELLPYLIHFAETGEINLPEVSEEENGS